VSLSVSLAGATGWAGSALARGLAAQPDLHLTSAVGRRHAGRSLGEVLDEPALAGVRVSATVAEALATRCDVFVEYTAPDAAKANILSALARGSHVVVGTSGLTENDFGEIEAAAHGAGRGVLACGNFALTVVLMQRFAEMAARHLPHWEIVDYAKLGKKDAPSGTARELAHRLGSDPALVHSLRVPGFVLSTEVIFGLPGQRLSLRHDSGESAEPYVGGALLAIRKVSGLIGLHRGLDTVLDP
jgi:4-hydroxy-tetrahydrodipicolinate reductase